MSRRHPRAVWDGAPRIVGPVHAAMERLLTGEAVCLSALDYTLRELTWLAGCAASGGAVLTLRDGAQMEVSDAQALLFMGEQWVRIQE